ncbi:hypothetical protein OUZ56_005970 [Daphnia magna]|uniref:Uncharacterized protein n=1 Tax=Daphnia magna TaxID=35525 RepID=A0ABQ9YU91_9CRUS|nr:hypothetical protein OUZ56_005970 [Daphnia magna]
MKIRGILDFELPYYCDNEKPETQHLPRIPTTYTLVTKQKPAATWKEWTCRQWSKTKKITKSFCIGSFDTVYSQETILITPLECWRMVNDKKCGDNNMPTGPTGVSQPLLQEKDLQEVRLEQRRAVTTTINSPIFGGILKANHGSGNIIWDMIAWVLLKNGQYPNGKCVTHHGFNKQLTMEDCDTDWTKCQDELKTFITSPLVQSQVSVGNCSKVTNKGQAFEYTSDFTIRPFNTNACIKANTMMLILQECANTCSIWGTFEHTGQLMATDRTGLHSPASDRKCLTLKVGRLSLGHCHGSSRKQHFSFEYRNPHQIRTLSAAAIIALHTQQSLDGTQLPPIPPLLKREKDPPVTKDHTITEDAIMEIIDDTEQTAQQEIPEAASLTLEQVPEVPIKGETESGLPQNIEEFGDKIKFEI